MKSAIYNAKHLLLMLIKSIDKVQVSVLLCLKKNPFIFEQECKKAAYYTSFLSLFNLEGQCNLAADLD